MICIASFDSTLLFPGGSLFNLLDDPENNFGLDEDEWLLVLSHLSAGMNHLRDNNLVHRFVVHCSLYCSSNISDLFILIPFHP